MKNLFKTKRQHVKISQLILVVIFLSIPFNLISQEVQNFDNVKAIKSGTSDLHSLYYDNQPSLLIKQGKAISSSDESENRVVELNVSNLHLLNERDYDLSSIELIRVIYNKSDKPSVLDLSKIKGLQNLKAIVFQCNFDCTSKTIEPLISINTKIIPSIYYLISIPE